MNRGVADALQGSENCLLRVVRKYECRIYWPGSRPFREYQRFLASHSVELRQAWSPVVISSSKIAAQCAVATCSSVAVVQACEEATEVQILR